MMLAEAAEVIAKGILLYGGFLNAFALLALLAGVVMPRARKARLALCICSGVTALAFLTLIWLSGLGGLALWIDAITIAPVLLSLLALARWNRKKA